jgi:hypothetical protein
MQIKYKIAKRNHLKKWYSKNKISNILFYSEFSNAANVFDLTKVDDASNNCWDC